MKLSQFERLIFLLSFGTSFIKYKDGWNELHQFKVIWLGVKKSFYCATLIKVDNCVKHWTQDQYSNYDITDM